jgi:phosphoglucomutase
LRGGNDGVNFHDAAIKAASTRPTCSPYVDDLTAVIDMDAIRSAVKIGVDPLGGAALPSGRTS